MMKMLSIVDRAMRSWLKEFFMSGFESIMILNPFPSNPKTPATKVISGTYIQDSNMKDQNFSHKYIVHKLLTPRVSGGGGV